MAPYKPPPPLPPWRLVWCPGEVRFRGIRKESNTQGRVYAIHGGDGLVWLGQSLRVIMEFARQYYGVLLHCSSGYRIIRKECTSDRHKGFAVCRLADTLEINALLERVQPLWIATVLRDPDKWETILEVAEDVETVTFSDF